MIDGAAKTLAARTAIVLACLLSAGCACLQRAKPAQPAIADATAAAEPAAAPAVTAQPAAVTPTVAEPVRPAAPVLEPRVAVPKAPAPAAIPRAAPPPTVAAPASPAPAVPKPAAVPVSPKPSPAPLDFKGLETRLRQTKAIGVLTKLSLKNQVDDLLARFRAYHQRRGGATLAELRRNYDMLLLKVLSLLQDTDPPLARDIVKSRAAMWSILEDPRKFTEFNRMAGATS